MAYRVLLALLLVGSAASAATGLHSLCIGHGGAPRRRLRGHLSRPNGRALLRGPGGHGRAGRRPKELKMAGGRRFGWVDALSFGCFVAEPCPSFPCGADQWAIVGNVDLPRSFFAPVDEDPVVSACPDWNGAWRLIEVFATGGVGAGSVAAVTRQGCAFQFSMEDHAQGVGFLYADSASLTLTFDPGGSAECTTTGYGVVDDVAFGFAFSPSCANGPVAVGGRKQRN